MNNTYGYIRGTEGVDGDHIDIFLSDTPEEGDVYIVNQLKEDGSFDDHKVMYGFKNKAEARSAPRGHCWRSTNRPPLRGSFLRGSPIWAEMLINNTPHGSYSGAVVRPFTVHRRSGYAKHTVPLSPSRSARDSPHVSEGSV